MIWLSSPDRVAPRLPAVWLIATDEAPATLPERCALRRKVALAVLANQFALVPEAVAIGHEAAGRPLLQRPIGTGLYLSLATRAGMVAVALAQRPVGVDVERIDPAAAPPLAALHPGEQAVLLALPEPARPLAFAQLWTAKEAYVKALGTGFRRDPASFQVELPAFGLFTIDDPERGPAAGRCCISSSGGQASLAAAVVVLD